MNKPVLKTMHPALPFKQSHTIFIEHEPGSSTMSIVNDYILSSIQNNTYVTILDSGYAYARMTELFGGRYITFQNQIPRYTIKTIGNGILSVFEVSRCFESISTSVIHDHLRCKPASLLIINELWRIKKIIPNWLELFASHIAKGGTGIICCHPGELDDYCEILACNENNIGTHMKINRCDSPAENRSKNAKSSQLTPIHDRSNIHELR